MPRPLDINSIENGDYYSITNANLGEGWKYEQNWQPKDNLGTRPGFVDVPVVSSNTPGAQLALKFKGKAIGIAIVSGGDAGYISYSIDRKIYRQVNLFTPWSGYLHLPWYILLNGDLKPGEHILKVRIESIRDKNSSGNACRIVNFLVYK